MAFTARIAAKFNTYYAKKPMLTTMITNAALGGVADTVAQLLTAVKTNSKGKMPIDAGESASTRVLDQNEGRSPSFEQLAPLKISPVSFDLERVARFMVFGFLMAPIQLKWFGLLSRTLPLTLKSPTVPVFKRVALDQLVFAPFGLACFFSFMNGAEGGSQKALKQKFSDVYLL